MVIVAASAFARSGFRLARGPAGAAALPTGAFQRRHLPLQLMYTQRRTEENGIGWATDYPHARYQPDDPRRVSSPRRRSAGIKRGEPNYWVVTALDDLTLFQCPFTMASWMSGTVRVLEAGGGAPARVPLPKGGFLWVDDFWARALAGLVGRQMRRVLPEYSIVDVPCRSRHPFRRCSSFRRDPPGHQRVNYGAGAAGRRRGSGADGPHCQLPDDRRRSAGRVMVLLTPQRRRRRLIQGARGL